MRRRDAIAAIVLLGLAACAEPGVRATRANDLTVTTSTDAAPATTTSSVPLDEPLVSTIAWTECDDDYVFGTVHECATLDVPLDYDDPGGEQLTLALVRVPATEPRVGAILYNPGGPGGSGFSGIGLDGRYYQRQMGLEMFDIVGFDPRGVDRSNGIRCLDDAFIDEHLYIDYSPDTPEEQELFREALEGFSSACVERYGDTLRHYSTANTARDMDMIRAAMGDQQLSFIGISYGTYLGGVYATMFPERVRAMVLDSASVPYAYDTATDEVYLGYAMAAEYAFDAWASWCEETASCAFTAADVGERWDALWAQLEEQPVVAADGRLAHTSVMYWALAQASYDEDTWPELAEALADVANGDAEGLFDLADAYHGRSPDGTFDTSDQSFQVINCASGFEDPPLDDPYGLIEQIIAEAPRFARYYTLERLQLLSQGCDGVARGETIVEIDYAGDGPIIVANSLYDPITPYLGAVRMLQDLGPNAQIVRNDDPRHGQILSDDCVTELEAAVLVSLELPDRAVNCYDE